MMDLTKLFSWGTWVRSSEIRYLMATFLKSCFVNECCIIIVLYLHFLVSLNDFTSINDARHQP